MRYNRLIALVLHKDIAMIKLLLRERYLTAKLKVLLSHSFAKGYYMISLNNYFVQNVKITLNTVAASIMLLTFSAELPAAHVTVIKNADGSSVQTSADGAKIVRNADGSSVETRSDGTEIVINKDGSSVQTNPDKTQIIKNADGSSVETRPDGTEIVTNADGSSEQTNPDGTKIIRDSNNVIIK